MQTRQMNVLEYLNEKPKIIIEEFQRNYEWNKTYTQKFLQTILKVGRNKNIKNKHLAHIYHQIKYSNDGLKQMKILVDGQQRITTIVLILLRISEYLNEHNVESIGYSSTEILNNFIINVYPKNEIKLLLHEKEFESLTQIVTAIENKETVQLSKDNNLEEIYTYIQKQVNDEEIISTVFEGLKKLRFTVEELGEDENIYDTYVELNSTSQPLSKQDQLKGFLFMSNFTKNNNEIYKQYYVPLLDNLNELHIPVEPYFRGMVYLLTGNPYAEIWGVKCSNVNLIDVLEYYISQEIINLEELCKICLDVSKTLIELSENSKLKNSIRIFKKFSFQPLGLFIRIGYLYSKNELSLSNMVDILNITESLIIRGKIEGLKFNEVPNWISFGKDVDFTDIESFKYNLRMWNSKRKIIVTDTEIYNTLHSKSVNPKIIKFILLELNNYLEGESVSLFNEDNVQVEHILPKSSHINPKDIGFIDYADYNICNSKIGNLTLLSQRKNVKASNNEFNIKKEIYIESPFKITKQLCDIDEFTKEELIKNTEKYSELFCKRWELFY